MAMALGKVKSQPFSEEELGALRSEWFALLPNPAEAAKVPDFQPFFLFAMAQTVKEMGDPDWNVLAYQEGWNYAVGVPVGFEKEMPRTPYVFPEKTK